MVTIKLKKKEEAITPSYAHKGDAGMDVFAAETCTLQPGERKLVPTGLHVAIPEGFEAQMRPKSGLALHHGIGMVNAPGTIDSSYRGEIKVILINFGKHSFSVEKGKKIAQMVFTRFEEAEFQEVDDLDETQRNEGGFGSTGLIKKR